MQFRAILRKILIANPSVLVDVPTSFPNREEEHVTLGPANQINRNLKEDERTNYGRNYYPVKSPTSTEKQQ